MFFCIPFSSLKDNIIRSQPIDKQQTMAQWFDDLMCGIERNVSGKNKEKYVEHNKIILIQRSNCNFKIYQFQVYPESVILPT